jgi:ADP-L-glycero-D-manno-heptose 6-epimerase
MIIVTGAAGFIGSCMVNKLNNKGFANVIVVDDFSRQDKMQNLAGKSVAGFVHRDDFMDWFDLNAESVDAVIHLGARTDTTETDSALLNRLNLHYSQHVFQRCATFGKPLIYASSAAVYGDGSHGYSDDHNAVSLHTPLNAYGVSKNEFDKWVLQQDLKPPFWAGLRFFNVFGPNEYHKGRMASVIWHACRQIREKGFVTLFRSHKTGVADGEQMRDFIYVKDVVDVIFWLLLSKPENGIFNLGTGKARSFNDLVSAVFNALDLKPDIRYIDTPADIRDKYQYYTCAEMSKLLNSGFDRNFWTLEEAIRDYVLTYLVPKNYY